MFTLKEAKENSTNSFTHFYLWFIGINFSMYLVGCLFNGTLNANEWNYFMRCVLFVVGLTLGTCKGIFK